MVKLKKYDYNKIEYSYFDLDYCNQKEKIKILLKNSIPKKVKSFSSKGSYWSFGDYTDIYHIVVNNGELHLTTYFNSFSIVFDFFNELMHFDNKALLYPFEDEGRYNLLLAIPVCSKNIRCVIFDEKERHNRNSLFITSDIIIDKQIFIKQWQKLFKRINKPYKTHLSKFFKDNKNPDFRLTEDLNKFFEKPINKIDKYLENPDKFKQKEPERYWTRIYDIAYKTIDGWDFVLAFDNNKRGNIGFWKKLKQENKILDFDYIEQEPQKTNWLIKDSATNNYHNICAGKIYTDFEERKLKNWCYSPDTEKWYSNNEPMDESKTVSFLMEDFSFGFGINTAHECECEGDLIKNYIKDSKVGYGWLSCYINLTSENQIFTFEFDYNEKDELIKNLNKIKNGLNFRFYLGRLDGDKRIHVWQKGSEYIKILYQEFEHNLKRDTDIFSLVLKKDKFIEAFKSAIKFIEYKIKEAESSIKNEKL